VASAERKNLLFDFGRENRIGRLERSDGGDGLGASELRGIEVGDADPADLAFLLQLGESGPAFFDFGVGVGPVDLVEIDGIDGEAAQTGFAFAADGIAPEGAADGASFVPDESAFREYIRTGGAAFERAADDFFGVAEPVNGGGVDPVDAAVEGGMDGGDGVGVVLGSPGEGQPLPPMAQAPTPRGVIRRSLLPRGRVVIGVYPRLSSSKNDRRTRWRLVCF
jgi:hypothetical protein